MKCKYCSSTNLTRRGKRHGKIRMQCKDCGGYSSIDNIEITKGTKVLLIDIETAYMEMRGLWALKVAGGYIPPERITKDWSILCYAAKWLFKPNVMGKSVTPEEAVNRTEESIIKELWCLLDEANIVVTHNGVSFDTRAMNTKFIKYGMPPPSRYLNVDTKVVSANVFRFPSNKLDYLAKVLLGLDGKMKMEIEDWDRCVEGDMKALEKMLVYCKKDIAPLLEDLYLKFLPWIPNHPDLNLYTGDTVDRCPRCLGEIKESGTYPTPTGLWRGFRCKNCGGIGRMTGKENKIKTATIRT